MKDADEFSQVYEREAQMVLFYVARRVLDGEVALDITAETFAQAFCGRRSFRGSTDAELRAWLLTIARRQISRYRGSQDPVNLCVSSHPVDRSIRTVGAIDAPAHCAEI